MLVSLAFTLPPAHAQHCALPAVLSALQGRSPPPTAHTLAPPANLDGRARAAPPAAKQIYGTPYATHLETTNFTINVLNGSADPALLERTGAALEAGWSVLIEQDGWTPPVGSDQYLVWVLLDDVSLGTGTGLTTEYTSDEFPQGYPVIYLNQTWASYEAFWEALAIHEFAHAVQFAIRDWNGGDAEAWFWEASAMWADEQVVPDNDTYVDQTWYYSAHPEYRFDSTTDFHQYGMVVLNASLEQTADQRGRVQAVWTAAADRPGEPWDTIMVDALETTVARLWTDFTAPMGNQALPESSLYAPVAEHGALSEGSLVEDTVPYLGTHYFRVTEPLAVSVTGEVAWTGPSPGVEDLSAGDVLAVTGLAADGADYRIETWLYPSDSDPPDTSPPTDGGGGSAPYDDPGAPRSCGCQASAAAPLAAWLLALLPALHRRR